MLIWGKIHITMFPFGVPSVSIASASAHAVALQMTYPSFTSFPGICIACKESNKSFITGEIEETSLDRLGEDGEDRGRGWDGSAHKRSSVNTDRNGEIQQRFRQIPPRRCNWAPWWCTFCFHACSCKCSCSC